MLKKLWTALIVFTLSVLLSSVQADLETLDPTLKVQTVWKNVWGIVQVIFVPNSKKVLTVHKTGQLHVYDSINAKNTDFTEILDISH